MTIKSYAVLLISILTLCFTSIHAQTTPELTPSHLHAAERMVEASGLLQNMQKLFPTIIKNQAAQLPEDKRAAFGSVMQKFFDKYITNDAIKKAFIPIYASAYTEDELNQIADFLSSPAGKAMTEKQPELMTKGMQWGQSVVLDHKDELKQMMKEAFNEK